MGDAHGRQLFNGETVSDILAAVLKEVPDLERVSAKLRRLPRLWVRDLDSLAARLLPGTEGAYNPLWSPDTASLRFAKGRLKKIDVAGYFLLETRISTREPT